MASRVLGEHAASQGVKDKKRANYSGSDRPADRSAERRTAREQRAEARAAIAALNRYARTEDALDAARGPVRFVSLLELGSTHTGGRRIRPRTPGLVLGDLERQRLRRQLEVAAECGTHYGAYRRVIEKGGTLVEQRLVCQHRCGTRACAECDAEIRRRECGRVAGNWRTFLTLGVPSAGLTVRQAWHRIRRARALLLKRLERAATVERNAKLRVDAVDAELAEASRRVSYRTRRRETPLDYAWCLEPHVSGFPHLHVVTNAVYINYGWLRKVWSECIGRKVRWSKVKKVYNNDGVCRYLSKYISKTSFPSDLCAVMYRQRLWGTSLPRLNVAVKEWVPEVGTDEAAASGDVHHPEEWAAEPRFRLELASRGRFALWERELHVYDDAEGAAEWSRLRRHFERPDRAPPVEREEGALSSCAWPWWDAFLECAYQYMSARWTLTNPVKVGETRASASGAGCAAVGA